MLERLLRTGSLNFHGSTIQIDPYTVTPMPIDPVSWAMYGHMPKPAKAKKTDKSRGNGSATRGRLVA